MEFAMLDELVRQCKEKGVLEIVGYFYQSGKNNMVFDLYEKFGFILNSSNGENTIWNLDISNYEKKNNLIEVKND